MRTGRDAIAAAVADVVLDHDGAELRTEQRAGRAHVEAGSMGAVLADVGRHQPLEVGLLLLGYVVGRGAEGRHAEVDRWCGLGWSLDEGHVPPLVGRSEEHTSELQSLMRISYA